MSGKKGAIPYTIYIPIRISRRGWASHCIGIILIEIHIYHIPGSSREDLLWFQVTSFLRKENRLCPKQPYLEGSGMGWVARLEKG